LLASVDFLKALRLPVQQQSDLCGYVLLALAALKPNAHWHQSTNAWMRIHDILHFIHAEYGIQYAENTRETIRKLALHHFRRAALVEDNGKATNSPQYRYRLTDELLQLLRQYGASPWEEALRTFLSAHPSLIQQYETNRTRRNIPFTLNGKILTFSPGPHNILQKAILEEFAPRFAPGAECLYVGDTAAKELFQNSVRMQQLGFTLSVHDKLPDLILYRPDVNWLYFIEAVTSVGPMDAKRIEELNALTHGITAGRIFVTAFLNVKTYQKFIPRLAWETEVWIAEQPDHMIHLNGNRFLGPR
jgi:hypothetical protein